MITTSDLKKGITIELDGTLYNILDFQHIKMGRGSAQVRMKLRDVRAGHTIERTFQAGDRFPRVRLEHRKYQFLYADEDFYHFMDNETFEQTQLNPETIGEGINYLKEGMNVEMLFYGDEPLGVDLPITVDLEIAETEPGFKGDTASGGSKPAKLETGLTVQVPLFLNTGDKIKVDTRTGTYIERVS
ncbi:MAG TPA: elongation factor P [Dehalococcoidia bacterium]|nr:elongation factor P [Dehalococcoidia bacterium]